MTRGPLEKRKICFPLQKLFPESFIEKEKAAYRIREAARRKLDERALEELFAEGVEVTKESYRVRRILLEMQSYGNFDVTEAHIREELADIKKRKGAQERKRNTVDEET